MKKINNELIQYVSGFVDGKFNAVDQLYKGRSKFLTNEELDNWYKKGFNDGNNYYLNKATSCKTISEFVGHIHDEDIHEIIQECFDKYQIENPKKNI